MRVPPEPQEGEGARPERRGDTVGLFVVLVVSILCVLAMLKDPQTREGIEAVWGSMGPTLVVWIQALTIGAGLFMGIFSLVYVLMTWTKKGKD